MRPSASQKEWLGRVTDQYAAAMTKDVRSYLASRGIEKAAVRGYRLGVVSDPDPAHEQYAGRLSIPHITPTGVVSMRFRCLQDHVCGDETFCAKYLGVSGESTRLFNVMALHEPVDVVAVCEGELDAIVATESGLPAVGVPGINNWKPFYYRLFDDYEKVFLLGDGDDAGRSFVATLSQHLPNSIRRPMPSGYDVSSFVVEHGPEELLRYVA